jgi:hypothetical protein
VLKDPTVLTTLLTGGLTLLSDPQIITSP